MAQPRRVEVADCPGDVVGALEAALAAEGDQGVEQQSRGVAGYEAAAGGLTRYAGTERRPEQHRRPPGSPRVLSLDPETPALAKRAPQFANRITNGAIPIPISGSWRTWPAWRCSAAPRWPSVIPLGQGRDADHEDRVRTARQPIGQRDDHPFRRGRLTDPSGDGVMLQAIGTAFGARRHGLDALALARPDQAGHTDRHVARRAGWDRAVRNGSSQRDNSTRPLSFVAIATVRTGTPRRAKPP